MRKHIFVVSLILFISGSPYAAAHGLGGGEDKVVDDSSENNFFTNIFSFIEQTGNAIFNQVHTLLNFFAENRNVTIGQSPPTFHGDSANYILSKMDICFKNYSNTCYRDTAYDFLQHFTLDEILSAFEENEAQPEVFYRCHEVTHYLGRDEYKRVNSIKGAYEHCTPVCHGGCYHGVIEAFFKEKNLPIYGDNDPIIAKEILKTCGIPEDYEKSRIYYECVHGIGHAMMFIIDGDLPYSLKLCDSLKLVSEREACYSGVFMESSSSSTNIFHPSRFVKEDDPMYPCNVLDDKYLNICYAYQSSYFSIITNSDWRKTIELCNAVPNDYRRLCFRMIGSNQVGYTRNLDVMKKNCDLISEPELKDVCVQGIVGSLGGRYSDPSLIIQFCSIVDSENKKSCYRQMGYEISWIDNNVSDCLKIPEEQYVFLCQNATLSFNTIPDTESLLTTTPLLIDTTETAPSEPFEGIDYAEQQKIITELSEASPREAWEYLKKTFIINGQVIGNSHEFSHIIGNEIYRQYGLGGVIICDSAFAFGCYHGVTEKMLLELGRDAVPETERKCKEIFPPEQTQFIASCIHGIGHGILIWERLDIEKALNDCDTLSEKYRAYCYDGVFMEHSFSSPKSLNVEDPWEFCVSFSEQYQRSCARYQRFGNFSTSSEICGKAPNKILKETCFIVLGFSAAYSGQGDADKIKQMCAIITDEDGRNTCIIYAAVETIFQEYTNWDKISTELCGELSEDWKKKCQDITQDTIDDYKRRSSSSNLQDYEFEIQQIKTTSALDEQVRWYIKLIERVGSEQAQEDLLHSGLPFTGQTHLLNHAVGDYLYEKYGASGLAKCKDYFLASCYHGFILHAIGFGLDEIDAVMAECKKGGTPVISQCAHALGHGFLAWVGYSNLIEALGLCDGMSGRMDQFPLFNCHDGVFMENVWGVHEGVPSPERWVDSKDPIYPCNDPRIDNKYLNGCWSNQPTLIYEFFNGDVRKIGEECLKVDNPHHKKTCFNGLARLIHPITEGSVDTTFQLCALMPSGWINYCITTIAIADFSVGGRDTSFKICARIDESVKESCYNSLYGMISIYTNTPEEHNELCSKIQEDEWQQKCIKVL